MAEDTRVMDEIRRLIDEEHRLRADHASSVRAPQTRQERIRELESQLDQCWDLLRQRRALRVTGASAEQAAARTANQVHGYLQ